MSVEVFPLALKYGSWTTNKLPYDKKIDEKKELVETLVNKLSRKIIWKHFKRLLNVLTIASYCYS